MVVVGVALVVAAFLLMSPSSSPEGPPGPSPSKPTRLPTVATTATTAVKRGASPTRPPSKPPTMAAWYGEEDEEETTTTNTYYTEEEQEEEEVPDVDVDSYDATRDSEEEAEEAAGNMLRKEGADDPQEGVVEDPYEDEAERISHELRPHGDDYEDDDVVTASPSSSSGKQAATTTTRSPTRTTTRSPTGTLAPTNPLLREKERPKPPTSDVVDPYATSGETPDTFDPSAAMQTPKDPKDAKSLPLLSIADRKSIAASRFRFVQNQFLAIARGAFSKGDAEATANDFQPSAKLAAKLYNAATPERTRECLRNKRIYMTGTSFHRSMFWSVIKHLRKEPYDAEIPERLRMVASSPKSIKLVQRGPVCHLPSNKTFKVHPVPWETVHNDSCLVVHDEGCNYPGPAGIDLERCGMPMSGEWRSDPDLNITVHYQFKTFVRAPPVDNLIFKTLKHSHWDLVWLSTGEWGSYKQEGPKWTKEEAVVLMKRLQASFGGVVLLSGDSSYTAPCKFFIDAAREYAAKHHSRMFVFEERDLVIAGKQKRVVEGHGHLGAITDAVVRGVFGVLCGT